MALSVQEVSAVLVMARPEAGSRVDSCLSWTSPRMAKSAAWASAAGGVSPSAAQTRKPNDLIRSLSTFSASCERSRPSGPPAALAMSIRIEIRGSPLLRMNSTRSSRDSWLSDFCTSRMLTTARVCISTRPPLPALGAPSCSTERMKAPELASSLRSISPWWPSQRSRLDIQRQRLLDQLALGVVARLQLGRRGVAVEPRVAADRPGRAR